ncbi:hypothetical protein GGR54DRAFT_544004 [Hypoxylon sp. NC1633]|nr:hypothetical protein GGR54DRAFT_544004 [Hypoxylon sp. NC1633]
MQLNLPKSSIEYFYSNIEISDTLSLTMNILFYQMSYWYRHGSMHPVRYLWPGLKDRPNASNPFRRPLHFLLSRASAYKATNPRDKYFALQALLPSSKGSLLYVDYNESEEGVFRRATARCYNGSHLHTTTTFKLFGESQQGTSDGPSSDISSARSWTQDFTYSDAHHHESNPGNKVTFEGYLCERRNWQPLHEVEEVKEPEIRCFAGPSTLFCSGVAIDVICTTGSIPDLKGDDWMDKFAKFVDGVLHNGQTYWVNLTKEKEQILNTRVSQWEAILHREQECINGKVSDGPPLPILPAEFKEFMEERETENINNAIPMREIVALFFLGGAESLRRTAELRDKVGEQRLEERMEQVKGKQYFTTSKGLVGISTAPVAEGDVLMVMHEVSAYFITREVTPGAEKHRIVARAVVHENKDQVKARMEGLETRIFQIV